MLSEGSEIGDQVIVIHYEVTNTLEPANMGRNLLQIRSSTLLEDNLALVQVWQAGFPWAN